MLDKKINIVYIDDNSDEILSQYMAKEYCATPFQQSDITQIEKDYKEVRFSGNEGYEALLQNVTVHQQKIITHLILRNKEVTYYGQQYESRYRC